MSRPRRGLLWSFLAILACLGVSGVLLLCSEASLSTHSSHIADNLQLPPPPVADVVADQLLPPPQELWQQDCADFRFNETETASSGSDAREIPPAELPETVARPVKPASRIGSDVVKASAIEESPPSDLDASLKDETNLPRQPLVGDGPRSYVRKNNTALPDAARPAASFGSKNVPAAAATTANRKKLNLLPDWLRRLPETVVTSIIGSDSEWDSSQPTPKLPPDRPIEMAQRPAPVAPPPPAATKPRQAPHFDAKDLWYEPETLIANLRELRFNPAANTWTAAVLQEIRGLGPAIVGGSDRPTKILDRLAELSRETPALAAKASDRAFARKWREIGYALDRRVDVWRQVVQVSKAPVTDGVSPAMDAKKLADCLTKIEAATGDSPKGLAWRDFLLIDALKAHCAKQPLPDERLSRETAQRALLRLTQPTLTLEQQRFVSSPAVAALRVELWHWAAEPISIAELLRDVERYERTRLPSDARRLAIDCQSLWASPVEARRQLGDHVDAHYRNANFRFTVTAELLNDLVPEQKLEYAPVNEMVVGNPVQGESLMANELAVRMLPDPSHARLALQVTGQLNALTTTDAGMARFHNESESRYVGLKPLEIDMKGISVWPVEVYVRSNTQLNGVETSIDGVPLLNWLARRVAQQAHDMNLPAASEEMRQKVVARASERIDSEVRTRLSEVVERLNQRLFDPLNSLSLDPQLIDAQTDKQRFTMRLRVGGEDQLGSHTPRPQAIEDSLTSLQIHESVINNGIQRLQLDGRTFSVPELSRYVASRLNCPAPWPTNPDNDDVKITFAEHNSVVVRCQDGQVVLMLSIAKLSKSPRAWRNFQIIANYRPVAHGRSAQLVREGVIQLIAVKSMGYQFALRGIFAHALSKKTPFNLIPEKIVNQPKLQDAAITQFVVNDGWIGLSLGPKPVTASHRQRMDVR
jgi:hypothetical protein